ncbi:MAG TPA: polymer-forming cytoskeletal protein [Candidatus Hydrogenedens sp.]|nr:polymer-forming cytoskeletal protein [Candidatus Hydrogenedens sp.]
MGKDEDKKETKSLFGKLRFRQWNEVLQANRAPQDEMKKQETGVNKEEAKPVATTEPIKQAQPEKETGLVNIPKPQRTGLKVMIIPENVYIEGSVRGECDAEIYGKINGNIQIKGNLILGKTAEVKGSIKALSTSIDGTVEGKIESTNDIEFGPNSKVQSELISGQRIIISGRINGTIHAEVGIKLQPTARLNGDITAMKWFSMQEGAIFNGNCSMQKIEKRATPQQPITTPNPNNFTQQQIKK